MQQLRSLQHGRDGALARYLGSRQGRRGRCNWFVWAHHAKPGGDANSGQGDAKRCVFFIPKNPPLDRWGHDVSGSHGGQNITPLRCTGGVCPRCVQECGRAPGTVVRLAARVHQGGGGRLCPSPAPARTKETTCFAGLGASPSECTATRLVNIPAQSPEVHGLARVKKPRSCGLGSLHRLGPVLSNLGFVWPVSENIDRRGGWRRRLQTAPRWSSDARALGGRQVAGRSCGGGFLSCQFMRR